MSAFLFEREKVKKFFNILRKMGRMNTDKYKEIYPSCICERDLFIRRTISKWFEGKYVILYRDNEFVSYKEFLSITRISFSYGYSDGLAINVFNFTRPDKTNDNRTLNFNDIICLEGRFVENNEEHLQIYKSLTMSDEPMREYIFEGYDMNIYNKVRKNKEERSKKEFIFMSHTYNDACKKVEEYSKNNPHLIIRY